MLNFVPLIFLFIFIMRNFEHETIKSRYQTCLRVESVPIRRTVEWNKESLANRSLHSSHAVSDRLKLLKSEPH